MIVFVWYLWFENSRQKDPDAVETSEFTTRWFPGGNFPLLYGIIYIRIDQKYHKNGPKNCNFPYYIICYPKIKFRKLVLAVVLYSLFYTRRFDSKVLPKLSKDEWLLFWIIRMKVVCNISYRNATKAWKFPD